MDSIDQSYQMAIYLPGGRWIVIFVSGLGFGEVRILTSEEMTAKVQAPDDEDGGRVGFTGEHGERSKQGS